MSRYYILSLSDAEVTRTDNAEVIRQYQTDDDYIVVDVEREFVLLHDEQISIDIEEDVEDPDEPGSEESQEE
jgi:hypothetical protein